jgi:hypothetical protein
MLVAVLATQYSRLLLCFAHQPNNTSRLGIWVLRRTAALEKAVSKLQKIASIWAADLKDFLSCQDKDLAARVVKI